MSNDENKKRKKTVSIKEEQQQEKQQVVVAQQANQQKPQFHKQKLHPFDFTGEDLADIKKIFPEFKPKRSVTRSSNKIVGLSIVELKKKLKEKIQLDGKQLQQLIAKLDHKNEEKITWSEFLTFLENEGMRREIVNDAQLYGMGVKRLIEGEKIILRSEEDRVIEYYIDCLCYIHYKSFRLLLALFENNEAKLLEMENFTVIQQLQFASEYALPKEQNVQNNNQQKTSPELKLSIRSKTPNISKQLSTSQQKDSLTYSLRKMDTLKTDNSIIQEDTFTSLNVGLNQEIDQQRVNQPNINLIKENSKSQPRHNTFQHKNSSQKNKQVQERGIRKHLSSNLKNGNNMNTTSLDRIGELGSYQEEDDYNEYMNLHIEGMMKNASFDIQEPKTVYGNLNTKSNNVDISKKLIKNKSSMNQNFSSSISVIQNQEQEEKRSIQQSSQRKRNSIQQKFYSNQKPSKLYQSQDEMTNSIMMLGNNNYGVSRNNSVKKKLQDTTQASTNVNYSSLAELKQEALLKRQQENSLRREILASKQKKKMFGILGLSQIEDQVGSQAYYLGKDLEKNRPFGLKDLFPNLYQDYDKDKRKFDQLMHTVDKEIKKNEVVLQQTRAASQARETGGRSYLASGSNLYRNTSIKAKERSVRGGNQEENNLEGSPSIQESEKTYGGGGNKQRKIKSSQGKGGVLAGDTSNESVRQAQMQLLAKRNKVINRIGEVKDKVMAQQEKLIDLKETNKYFYKMVNPLSEVNGNRKQKNQQMNQQSLFSNEQNNNSEMIGRFVEKLNKNDSSKGEKGQFLGDMEGAHDISKKNKIRLTKQIYSVCASFHEILQILAISLIDKEIKIYKMKQNGAKIVLADQFSFISKFLVTCLHIEQYVVNSRPILCLGSNTGEIAIYYIDEPVINAFTKIQETLPGGGLRFKQLLLQQFNFFTRGQSKEEQKQQQQQQQRSQEEQMTSLQNESQTSIINKTFVTAGGTNGSTTAANNNNTQIPSYLLPQQMENELTCIKYMRDIGLLVTSFNGTVKIFDGFDFKEVWKSTNKSRKQIHHTNIITFDVSTPLGLMATGGAEGKLVLIDPYALGIINSVQAHNPSNSNQSCEILSVQFYEDSQQIFTISADRSIAVWDAYRLEKIQLLKDVVGTHTPKYTSAAFDKANGIIFTGCQAIKMWEAKVDQKVEIKAIQVETLSKTILKERKMVELSKSQNEEESNKKGWGAENKNGTVLVTNTSELVDILINEKDDTKFLITVDSENLLRCWNIKSSATAYSYKIPMKKRVTAIAVDNNCQHLAVGNCIGEVQILNLKSGGILYNLPHTESEVTCLQFLSGMSEFWLVSGCWHGKVMMWTNPNEDNNFTITAKCRIGHRDDVLVMDASNQFIVSGGVDGLVSVWNLFSGVLKFAIALPPPSNSSSEMFGYGIIIIRQQDLETNQCLGIENEDQESISLDEQNSDDSGLNKFSQVYSSPKSIKKNTFGSPAKSYYSKNGNNNIEDIGFNITTMASEKGGNQQKDQRASHKIKQSIVGLCFHPYYSNLVCVLQEGGDIHIVDVSNGTLAYEYVAKSKINSNWACDKENQRIFIVGDVGRACLMDMSLQGSAQKNSQDKKFNSQFSINLMKEGQPNVMTQTSGFGINNSGVSNQGSNKKVTKSVGGSGIKWRMVKNWFITHKIHKMDPTYIVSVKYASNVKIFITGTSKGEVKLWHHTTCDLLGVLNSSNYDPSPILQIIQEANKEEMQKEIEREEHKQKKKIKDNLQKLESGTKFLQMLS